MPAVPVDKAPNGIPPSLCAKQTVGSSSLPVAMAKSHDAAAQSHDAVA